MYEYIQGKLISLSIQSAVIDVNGIGFRLHIPVRTMEKMPALGQIALLYTSWVIREASQTLFGFICKEERDFFDVLITFSGIGPKTALSLIGHLSLEQVGSVVRNNQSILLSKVPGIGKKTAEKLIVDLKSRQNLFIFAKDEDETPLVQDALKALVHLGYSPLNAEKAIKKAQASLPENAELSTLIRTALSSG